MARRRSKKRRQISNLALNLVQRAVIRGTAFLPFRHRSRIGGWLGRQAARHLPGARRRIENNLRLVYPDLAEPQLRAIRDGAATALGRTITEILLSRGLQRQGDRITASGPGLEVLRDARASGQGAILVSGHFGQWEAARIYLKRNGMECGAIYRPNNNPYYDADFKKSFALNGEPVFARGATGTRAMIRHLRQGGFTAILIDQAMKTAPVLEFMGHPAHTSTAAAEMAAKFDLPLIPVFGIRRDETDSYDVEFEAPIAQGDPVAMTLEANRRLEARIRAHPDQWFWLHKRWKVAPRSGKSKAAK